MAQPLLASVELSTPDETARFAGALAPDLVPGDVLLLDGEIGTGKTHFARSLIQHRQAEAGLVEDVPSPTFTLVQTYSDGSVEIWHADLYRISSPGEVIELGLEEAFSSAISLIEWPDRLGLDLPGALELKFAHGKAETVRILDISGDPAIWKSRVEKTIRSAGLVDA